MYSDMEKITPKYEQRINELLEQVREYKSQIYQYKALLEDKDYHITLLYNENLELKAQIQNLPQPATSSPVYTPQLHPPPDSSQNDQLTPIPTMQSTITPPPTMQSTITSPSTMQSTITPPPTMQTSTTLTSRSISTTMKRQCPNCGAYGFAIREIEDKTQIISYVPRRIYAKKKHCTKCGYEF